MLCLTLDGRRWGADRFMLLIVFQCFFVPGYAVEAHVLTLVIVAWLLKGIAEGAVMNHVRSY